MLRHAREMRILSDQGNWPKFVEGWCGTVVPALYPT